MPMKTMLTLIIMLVLLRIILLKSELFMFLLWMEILIIATVIFFTQNTNPMTGIMMIYMLSFAVCSAIIALGIMVSTANINNSNNMKAMNSIKC